MAETVRAWRIEAAGARFGELVDEALRRGPQLVTRHGKPAVVVVAAEEWECCHRRRGALVEFFASSPLREGGLDIPRLTDPPRDIEL